MATQRHGTLAGSITAAACSSRRIHPAKGWDHFSGFSGINGAAPRTPHTARTGCCWHKAGVDCAGGARGEMIIEEAAALWRKMSKRMVARVGAATAQVTDRHASLQASGRAQGSLPLGDREALAPEAVGDLDGAGGRKRRAFFQDRARQSMPVTLPQVLEATEQAACPAGGLAHALAVDVGHLHVQERGMAVSSLRERMRNWTDTGCGTGQTRSKVNWPLVPAPSLRLLRQDLF